MFQRDLTVVVFNYLCVWVNVVVLGVLMQDGEAFVLLQHGHAGEPFEAGGCNTCCALSVNYDL